ncbi:expressed unknown protein [Seminavis robusta]|uniref:Uncharacterized protein n=1 Tax=Seminavis robusta TaxID=568900 RepID=A0A9N8ESK0_9STRA|nr:expressed unknown protein [Seminavis robusta]|eukprot:Sro1705_g292470.1 n/a (129) ;mRNA; f:21013-21484
MLQKEADELRETIRKLEQEKSEKAKVLETTQSGANSSSEESKCKCGFIYKEGNRFCGGCGRKLAWCCKKCKHEENSVSYKFCVECGAAKCSSSRDSRSKRPRKRAKRNALALRLSKLIEYWKAMAIVC